MAAWAALLPLLKSMGSAVAARAGAQAAAQTAVQAAPAAAKVTAQRAGAQVAAQAGAQAMPGAAKAAAQQSGAYVLEDAASGIGQKGFAQSLTQALSGGGQQPVNATSGGGGGRPPVRPQNRPPVNATAGGGSGSPPVRPQNRPPVRRQPPPLPTQSPTQPSTKPPPRQPQPPPRQPTQQRTPIQSAVDRFQQWRQARAANRQEAESLKTPVKEQVRGMTWPQRLERLAERDRLLDPAEVSRQTGIQSPSTKDTIKASEQSEEQERIQRLEQLNTAMEDMERPLSMMKKGLAIFGSLATVGIAATKAMLSFSRNVVASNENLRRFAPALADSYAQLERQDLLLKGRTARATSGSATAVNDQWMKLREEFQSVHETIKTIKNMLAVLSIAQLRSTNAIAQGLTGMPILVRMARAAERFFGKGEEGVSSHYQEFLRDIANNNWSGPTGARPEATRRRR